MTTNPRPILCDTDSEIQNTETDGEQFFKHNEPFESIPDFTDTSTNINIVKNKNDDKQMIVNEMIYNFDQNDNSENKNDDITKIKFSSMIGEMRVDILSLVNLIGVLNKNVTSNNDEIQNLKKEIQRVITDNVSLKEKIARLKDDQMCMRDTYDALFLALEKKQTTITEEITEKTKTKLPGVTKIVKKNDQDDEKNEFNDALMEKRTKFKVVPTRTRVGNDMFGAHVEINEEPPLSNTTRQIMRKENIDNASKKTKDTSQIRGARMGLLDLDTEQTLTTSSSSAAKNAKSKPRPYNNHTSTRRK